VAQPNWNKLYLLTEVQQGYFTTAQAEDAGYSSQLVQKHLKGGKMTRVRRGVYRLAHYPRFEHDELVVVWLWSERTGVFSHETALSLHGISDVLPARVHLTVPSDWRRRRLRVPEGVILYFADVPAQARAWVGPIPVTNVARTLADCVASDVSGETICAAIRDINRRGLLHPSDVTPVEGALLKRETTR